MSDPHASKQALLHWLLQAAAALLTTAVLIPVLTPTAPAVYFDLDPRYMGVGGNTITAWGPGPVSVLHVLVVLLAIVSSALAVLLGARINRWVAALLGVGVVVTVCRMESSAAVWEDWLHGGAWISAAFAGLAASLIGQIPAARRWVLGLTVAVIVPVVLTAGWYVWVEHPFSVEQFEANKADIFAAQGIEAGTEQAELYERRLRFSDATGAIGLSNVLGSIAAAAGVMSLGMAVGLIPPRGRRDRGVALTVALVLVAMACCTVYLTGSTGAVVGAVLGAGVLGAALLVTRLPKVGGVLPVVAVGVVALAFMTVIVRGAMGPPAPPPPGEAVQGERSLLFRYQYWTAATRIAMDHPLLGSGVGGFADGYLREKDPLNPESVTSTHNVFVDYITMLGVGGLAWSLVLVSWLWTAGRNALLRASSEAAEEGVDGGFGRPEMMLLAVCCAALFGSALRVQQASLYLDTAVLWLVAIGLYVAVASLLIRGLSERAARWGLLGAAVVVLAHNQIEMSFFQPASTGLLWLLLGAAGAAAGVREVSGAKRNRLAWPGVVLAGSVVTLGFMVLHSMRVGTHEAWIRDASVALARNDTEEAWRRLEAARDSVDCLDTRALRWQVRLYALEPLTFAPSPTVLPQLRPRVAQALTWLEQEQSKPSANTSVARVKATLLETTAQVYGDPPSLDDAITAYQQLVEQTPYNINDTLALADLYARRGRADEAAAMYRRVLELCDAKYLDPADPLPAHTMSRIRDYLQVVD